MTGRLSSSDQTSSRSPNGAATVKPSTSRPIGDHSRIGIENTAATRKRLRMSATMAAIDIPACPPWPMTSSGEHTTSSGDGAWPACAAADGGAWAAWAAGPAGAATADGTAVAGVAVRGRVGLHHRVAHVRGHRLARAVVAALGHPAAQLDKRRRPGVIGHRRGLRDRVRLHLLDARPAAEHRLHDRLLAGPVETADVKDGRAPLLGLHGPLSPTGTGRRIQPYQPAYGGGSCLCNLRQWSDSLRSQATTVHERRARSTR